MNKLERQQARLNGILANPNLKPTAVVLEGRDTAGKSSTIRELTHYMPTDSYSVVLSTKPTSKIMKGWLKFWETKLPKRPMITFFDRSWYSRSMVQPINSWCSDEEYCDFMLNVNNWEANQDVEYIKFWLSISEDEQNDRINERKTSPLKSWKLSPNDIKALSYYDEMTILKERVMTTTNDWYPINYNDKKEGRLALITKLCDTLEERIVDNKSGK